MRANSNWRMLILALLGMICLVFIAGEPTNQETWHTGLQSIGNRKVYYLNLI